MFMLGCSNGSCVCMVEWLFGNFWFLYLDGFVLGYVSKCL